MIKAFRILVINFICLFLLNSCGKEENVSDGYGTLDVVLSPSSETVNLGGGARNGVSFDSDSLKQSRTKVMESQDFVPQPEEFSLGIYSDEVIIDYWEKFSDYDSSKRIAVGTYNLIAKYGDPSKEGFYCPYYEGNSVVTIRHSENTDASIECKLSNVKVSVVCSEALKNYFTSFTMEAVSSLNNPVVISKNETNSFYLSPGSFVLTAEFVKQNGQGGKVEIVRVKETSPQQHYTITVDVNDGEVGGGLLKVMYNTVQSEEVTEIDLSDASLNIKEPVFTAEGIENAGNITMREGSQPSDLKVTLNARAGIKTCDLYIDSHYLKSLGIPEKVDLASTDEEEVKAKRMLEEKGLRLIGLNDKLEKLALIDFTPLVMNLICLDGTEEASRFTLRSTDVGGRVQEEEFTFNVLVQGNQFFFPGFDSPVMISSTEAYAKIKLLPTEGSLSGQVDVNNVIFEYQSETGEWVAAETKWDGDDIEDKTLHYAYVKNLPPVHTKLNVRARYGSKISDIRELDYYIPEFQLKADADDVWARKATAKITAKTEEELKAVLGFMEIKQGGTVLATLNENSATFQLEGLTPGTSYQLQAVCNGEKSSEYSLVTESPLQLPNSDFEQWQSGPYDGQTINKGGPWSKKAGSIATWGKATYEKTNMISKEPVGWCTVNTKTMSTYASNINFWYIQSSTNKSDESVGNGSSVCLRNVGWSSNGEAISLYGTEAWFGTYYETFPGFDKMNTPSQLNYSAGRLFLGTYSYNHSSGTEEYNEGYSFASRPARMTFQYKYISKIDETRDKGYVRIVLKGKDGVIFETYQELEHTTNVLTKNIEFSYPENCMKATTICVMFCSSFNGASLNQSDENSKISHFDIGYDEYKNQCCVTGSELYIDNINLEY